MSAQPDSLRATPGAPPAPVARSGRRAAPRAATQGAAPDAARRDTTGPALSVVSRPAPVARLGLAWGAALLTATALDPLATAVVVAPVAAVAAASMARARSGTGAAGTLAPGSAAALAAAVSLAAIGGSAAALVAVAVAGAVAAVVGRHASAAVVVAAPAVAAASLVVAASEAGIVSMALASAVCLWDLAVYAMGTESRRGGAVGTAAATASIAVLAVLFAAIADPPLSGDRPWLLFGLLAVAAPAGVALGARIEGRRRLPALRRLDSLLVAGPAWVVGTQVLLHR